jgi:hypothetical protein
MIKQYLKALTLNDIHLSRHENQLHLAPRIMLSARTFITPVARAAFRPQIVRVSVNTRLASIRAASTISEAITKDHRELKQYYDEIVNNPDNIDHQTRFGNQFTWELARHSVAEELLVYPALEKYLGDKGKEHADHDRAEHHKVGHANNMAVQCLC